MKEMKDLEKEMLLINDVVRENRKKMAEKRQEREGKTSSKSAFKICQENSKRKSETSIFSFLFFTSRSLLVPPIFCSYPKGSK